MAVVFSPASGTVNKTEFAGTSQTVSIQTATDLDFEIKNVAGTALGTVTYTHPYGYTFSDMVITVAADGKSFTFNSVYNYAVRRTTYYLIQDQPTAAAKQYFNVESPHLLPENFKGIYRVDPPEASVTLTFSIVGRERTVTVVPGDPLAVPPVPDSTTYGEWYAKTYTWTMNVQSSNSYTATAIKNAVKQGQGYKRAIEIYPEVTLP